MKHGSRDGGTGVRGDIYREVEGGVGGGMDKEDI